MMTGDGDAWWQVVVQYIYMGKREYNREVERDRYDCNDFLIEVYLYLYPASY